MTGGRGARRLTIGLLVLPAAVTLLTLPAIAQDVSGNIYEDRNDNGIRDAGEPGLASVDIELFGTASGAGAVDTSVASAADGSFSFSPGNGCYLLRPADPAGWRAGISRSDRFVRTSPATSDPLYPVGQPRVSKLDLGLDHLRAGSLRYTAIGDSIATNFNFCELPNLFGSFAYHEEFQDRLQCVAPGASITLDQAAVKGEHTDDLLVLETNNLNNVFQVIAAQPDLVSLSMIGNDLLGVDIDNPTQAQVNTAVEEVLDSRRNLQEVLSSILTEVPDADIVLNTLYDNLASQCNSGTPTSNFHRTWLPIINQVLRETAWGQTRRIPINEVAAEFSAENQSGACDGYTNMICLNSNDGIHPVQPGYDVVGEKLWESAGGVLLGPTDALGRTSFGDADFGYLRRVRRLEPTTWETRDGAAVVGAAGALSGSDADATASIALGPGTEEFRVAGFPDWFDEIEIVRAVAGVRYRTTGTFMDQLYRIDASRSGTFEAPPGHSYTPTDWNFSTPIVGAGGPNAPVGRPDYGSARLLVTPNVASYRDASATLTANPQVAGDGEYLFPSITHEDLSTTTIRVAAANVGANAGTSPRVELETAWVDLYGYEKARPAEIAMLRVDRQIDGSLETSFESLAGSQRYNLYTGSVVTLRTGAYDHGASVPAACAAPTIAAGAGREAIVTAGGAVAAGNLYFLVTGHVDDVESPAGFDSAGGEIDRSRSSCR